ncbi:Transcription factor LHW [Platanthera zijinensis]|uniref:Transcription factor LHW n=1 Tax=Platanthera zijinensis TaxID=2320716 RepID=A0AAP0BKR3_9ASPA
MDGTGIAALCRSMSWTYGVIWRIDRRDPRLLTLEGSYYEGKSGRIFEKMIKDVHVIGQGTIGEIAISGKYRWINFHAQSMQSCEIGADVKSGMLKNYTEWQHQILAGLKTVAVISQPGLGVILFGSTQKILESPNLVEKAQHLLLQLANKQFRYDHADWNSNHQHQRLSSVISFMDSTFKNNILPESFDRERWDSPSSTYSPSLDPELISPGSQVFSLSASSGSSNGFSDLFRGSPSTSSHSSHQFANQQTASKKARLLSECNDSSSTLYKSNIRAKETHSSSSMDVSEVLNMIPTFSCSSTPCSDTLHVHRVGNSLELRHCSSSPVSVCSISTVISSLKPLPQAHDEPMNKFGTNHIDSSGQSDDRVNNSFSEIHKVCDSFAPDSVQSWNENTSPAPTQIVSDVDIFDGMEFDLSPMILMQECWEDIILPADSNSCTDFSTKISDCLLEFELGSVSCTSNELVPADANRDSSCDSVVTATSSVVSGSLNIQTPELSFSQCRPEKSELESLEDVQPKLLVRPWIDDSCSVNAKDSRAKVVRKRARPGESTRPRPKDRQQIQDRLKELREIVPNGSKCSIDALLELTIRHMIFLRNVMEYSDKLKLAEGPKKMIGEENGVVLKDSTNGGLGGTTWAYEGAGQTMVCPLLVDDLHPSRQMLVEMLCEERGFFLEIADIVRGFGLTILKGVLEIRGTKIWARFLLEANRDVTRMDIFLSLVHLLQQTSSARVCEPRANAPSTGILDPHGIPIGLLG